jgi:hypothetical protein
MLSPEKLKSILSDKEESCGNRNSFQIYNRFITKLFSLMVMLIKFLVKLTNKKKSGKTACKMDHMQ